MATRIAVLDDYQGAARTSSAWADLPPDTAVTFFADHLAREEDLVARLAPFPVVVAMRERTPFPASLLDRLPKLRLLVTTGMRNRSFDLGAAARRGILVSGTEGIMSRGTMELTWGLILALARHIPEEDRAVREGAWQTTVGVDLLHKRLGLLGLGSIGARVATVAHAFEMEVVAWSEHLTDERAAAAGARRVSKEELLETADVVSIHLVLSDRTRGLLGASDLARMKPSAYLVNTSRGPIVDEPALVSALERGAIAGAGLDVFDQEPLPLDHPLRRLPNTVVTPHLGYVTEESYAGFFQDIVGDVRAWLAGSPVRQLTP